jgi:uncharacterized membrane protein
MYNIHPIFVHFPIALLFIYSVIKIIPFQKWLPKISWIQIERVLLFVGVLGAFSALYTGDIAEHLTDPNRQIVELHSSLAYLSTFLYGLLFIGELLAIFSPIFVKKFNNFTVNKFIAFFEKILTDRIFGIVVSLFGLLAISLKPSPPLRETFPPPLPTPNKHQKRPSTEATGVVWRREQETTGRGGLGNRRPGLPGVISL